MFNPSLPPFNFIKTTILSESMFEFLKLNLFFDPNKREGIHEPKDDNKIDDLMKSLLFMIIETPAT